MAFIVITILLVMTFSFPVSLWQRGQSQRACQQTKTAKLQQSKEHFLSLSKSKLRAIGLTLTLAPFWCSRNSSTDTCFISVTSRLQLHSSIVQPRKNRKTLNAQKVAGKPKETGTSPRQKMTPF
jgi:hypothetical protein